MKGFEAFGISDGTPTVRRLGLVTFTKGGGVTTEEQPGTEEWHPDEVHDGVASVEIHSHADGRPAAYIYVCGTDRDAVENAWLRARDQWNGFGKRLWNPSVRRARNEGSGS